MYLYIRNKGYLNLNLKTRKNAILEIDTHIDKNITFLLKIFQKKLIVPLRVKMSKIFFSAENLGHCKT